MSNIKIQKTTNNKYLNAIVKLYIESFGKGVSAQYINTIELYDYINTLFETGYAIIYTENEYISGILLATTLGFDTYLPELISNEFETEKCLYVAEMMVSEQSRGKGIGRKLLEAFETTADKKRYTDAFIRVWDENTPALSLYRKMGYSDCAQIEQTKRTADGNGTFVMNKIYLHKKLI